MGSLRIHEIWASAAVAALFAAFGCGGSSTQVAETTILPRATWAADDSWASIAGTVVQTGDDAFVLDYGGGRMTVEMDDWDWLPEGRTIILGDEVVVYGRVDNDFYEEHKIEAGGVYVRALGKMFFASSDDEEALRHVMLGDAGPPRVDFTGTVKSIQGSEFQLQTPTAIVDVETRSMHYDPLDDEGVQRLRVGDRVRVSGRMGPDLFGGERDLDADTIVTLHTPQAAAKDTAPKRPDTRAADSTAK